MLCPICHKYEGEWQCQVCRRIVCANDARPTSAGVYCIEHAPRISSKPQQTPARMSESSSLSSVKSAFLTMLFLTLGIVALVYIGTQFIKTAEMPESVQSALDSLSSVGTLIIAAMGFITIILGFAYIALRRRQ